jgi:NAD(P)-dependent dehydrogenase (short-subunit alcohol dehydrogenase family)
MFGMTRLTDKVAIITGAASGIGRATAYLMAREGAVVVILDINRQGAEEVARDIKKSGGRALALKTDVASDNEVKQMVEKTIEEFGRVDILVNGAALVPAPVIPIQERDMTQVETELNVTLTGAIRCCRSVVPHMLKQMSGRIISVTSDASKTGASRMSIYSAAKAGVAGFSRAVAQELATKGITVNCVCPGSIKTPAMTRHLIENPRLEKAQLASIPMHRMGEPEDIAAMVVFLASDDAKYITGQEYSVDGGTRM